MKYLLLIFLTTSLYAQKLYKGPYTAYNDSMDSKVNKNFNLHPNENKAIFNAVFSHRYQRQSTSRVDNMSDFIDPRTYISLAAYDVKTKIRLSKRLRLLGCWLRGDWDTYYSIGLLIKFK